MSIEIVRKTEKQLGAARQLGWPGKCLIPSQQHFGQPAASQLVYVCRLICRLIEVQQRPPEGALKSMDFITPIGTGQLKSCVSVLRTTTPSQKKTCNVRLSQKKTCNVRPPRLSQKKTCNVRPEGLSQKKTCNVFHFFRHKITFLLFVLEKSYFNKKCCQLNMLNKLLLQFLPISFMKCRKL